MTLIIIKVVREKHRRRTMLKISSFVLAGRLDLTVKHDPFTLRLHFALYSALTLDNNRRCHYGLRKPPKQLAEVV
jgi:hypothetical protein